MHPGVETPQKGIFVHHKTCAQVFIAAMFINPKPQNNPNIHQQWKISINSDMQWHQNSRAVTKQNSTQQQKRTGYCHLQKTWMNLSDIMVSKRIQTKERKLCSSIYTKFKKRPDQNGGYLRGGYCLEGNSRELGQGCREYSLSWSRQWLHGHTHIQKFTKLYHSDPCALSCISKGATSIHPPHGEPWGTVEHGFKDRQKTNSR